MSDGTDLATRVREHIEASARAQATPGEAASALWASGLVPDRVAARQAIVGVGEDYTAWRLAGRREWRVATYQCALGFDKLSPGQAAAQAEWGKQHAGWSRKESADPAKQAGTEAREQAAGGKLKVAG
jgi:hypothetical protein